MTYRQDSDFPHPYGHIIQIMEHPRGKNEIKNIIEAFGKKNRFIGKGKTKPIAWFASNCFTQSKREAYVEELKKYMNVS